MALKALGYNMLSGTAEALTYDSLKTAGRERDYIKVDAKASIFMKLASALGSLASLLAGVLRYAGYYLADAATAVAGARVVLLTTGRQGLAAFAGLGAHCVVRSVDPPEPPLPARTTVVLARGPFTVEDERALMTAHGVDVVVTKDSGGPMTAAKLTAARELGVPVVLVRRPPLPEGVPVAATVEEAAAWVLRLRGTTTRSATPCPR